MPHVEVGALLESQCQTVCKKIYFPSHFFHIKMPENVAYCHSIRNSHPFKLELVSFSFSFLLSIVTFLFDLAPFHLPHLHIYYSSSSSSVLNVFFRRKEKKNWLHDTRNNKETGLPIKLFYSLYFIRTLSSSLLRFLFLEKSYIFGPVSLSQLFFSLMSRWHVSLIHHRVETRRRRRKKGKKIRLFDTFQKSIEQILF